MRNVLAISLLTLGCVLASPRALAEARATVTVNGVTRTLSQSGSTFGLVELVGGPLGPGESASYSLDYTLTVHDDGLPVPPEPLPDPLCNPFIIVCGPLASLFEVAKVDLIAFYRDARSPPLEISGGSQLVSLSTSSPSFAESLERSGTLNLHVHNKSAQVFPATFGTYAALWVIAAPIPEPTTAAQLLAGLALGAGLLMRRRRLNRG